MVKTYPFLLKWAETNGYSVVAWNNGGKRQSFKDIDRMFDQANRRNSGDKDFDKVSAAWAKAYTKFARENRLATDGLLLWGLSGGAQYAHRLALRQPKFFGAVHITACSSYDLPTPDGAEIFWLVTVGEREAGFSQANLFYRTALSRNYRIVLMPGLGVGHACSLPMKNMGLAFFGRFAIWCGFIDRTTSGVAGNCREPSGRASKTSSSSVSSISRLREKASRNGRFPLQEMTELRLLGL